MALYGIMKKPLHPGGGERSFAVMWLSVAAVLAVPIWLPSIPPLSDFYNHLARDYILAHRDDVALYRAYYEADWQAIPNLGMDLIATPLLAIFDLELVAKLFLTLTVLLWHAGCAVLGRALYGYFPRRALVCSFFAYNQMFLHGYVNYSLGMALALFALALWLTWREQLASWRIVPLTALVLAVFLGHLSAFVTLGIVMFTVTVMRLVARRRITLDMVLAGVTLVPGVIMFLHGFLQRTGQDDPIAYPSIFHNLRDSPIVLVGYSVTMDAISMVAVAILVAIAIWRRTGVHVHRDALGGTVALAVAYWVFPSDVATGVEALNVRFALGAVTLLVLAIDIELPERMSTALLAACLALFTARTAVMTAHWIELDRAFQRHLEAFATIEEGAAVHNIYFYPPARVFNAPMVRGLALIHTPSYAAVTRHALVPTLYGVRGQQPLVHRIPMYRAHRFHDRQRPEIQWDRIFGHYHYVWTCRAPADLIAPLVERGRLRATVDECALYALDAPEHPPAAGAAAPNP